MGDDAEPSHEQAELEQTLQTLPQVDLAPFAARALLVAAQRRLTHAEDRPSWMERHEAAFLVGLSAVHLVWGLMHAWRP